MARAEAMALVTCHECDFEKAEIRRDKKGLLYRYCPECSAQYFTRKQVNSDRLEAKVFGKKPPENVPESTVTVTEKKPPENAPPEAPKKPKFSLGDL